MCTFICALYKTYNPSLVKKQTFSVFFHLTASLSYIQQVDMVHVAFVCDTLYVAYSKLRVTFITCNREHINIKRLALLKISQESSIMNVNNCIKYKCD